MLVGIGIGPYPYHHRDVPRMHVRVPLDAAALLDALGVPYDPFNTNAVFAIEVTPAPMRKFVPKVFEMHYVIGERNESRS